MFWNTAKPVPQKSKDRKKCFEFDFFFFTDCFNCNAWVTLQGSRMLLKQQTNTQKKQTYKHSSTRLNLAGLVDYPPGVLRSWLTLFSKSRLSEPDWIHRKHLNSPPTPHKDDAQWLNQNDSLKRVWFFRVPSGAIDTINNVVSVKYDLFGLPYAYYDVHNPILKYN